MSPRPALPILTTMLLSMATVAVLQPLAAAAAELPRVFFTPGERAAITARRLAGGVPAVAAVPAAADARVPDAPRPADSEVAAMPSRPGTVRLEGVSNGPKSSRAAWIGGERVPDGGQWRGYRVRVLGDGIRLFAADGSVRRVVIGTEPPL